MYLFRQFDLDALAADLNAMGGAVVERNPIRENIMGIETLNEKQWLPKQSKGLVFL